MARIEKRIDKHCVKRAWSAQWREVRAALLALCVCVIVLLMVYR